MSDIKVQQSMINLERALLRLQEALAESKHNSLVIDATIQRFEFVIELYWKILKKAYAADWLTNETAWLQMLQDRNETYHVYDEEKAQLIYQHIHDNFPELQNTFNFLKEHFSH